jgi:hypothetical protein
MTPGSLPAACVPRACGAGTRINFIESGCCIVAPMILTDVFARQTDPVVIRQQYSNPPSVRLRPGRHAATATAFY